MNNFKKISAAAVASYMALNAAALPTFAEQGVFKDTATVVIQETVNFKENGELVDNKIADPGIRNLNATIAATTKDYDPNSNYVDGKMSMINEGASADVALVKTADWNYKGTINLGTKGVDRAGIYTFTISESAGSYAGLNVDQKTDESVQLNVYVAKENNTYVIKGYTISEEGNPDDKTIDQTVNLGNTGTAVNFEVDYETYSLTVTNSITGAMSNPDKEFNIVTQVSKPKTESDTEFVGPDGVTVSDALADQATHVIRGIPAGYGWTVTQTDEKGYTTKIDNVTQKNEDEKYFNTGTINGAAAITVENTATVDSITPTGIFNKTAPFALMLAGAGAFAALFFRKKREEA